MLFKPSTWSIVKAKRDIENYKDWIRVIKREKRDPNSKLNQWKIDINFFYTLYFIHNIEEAESQLPEQIMRLRMIESLAPLHRYLDEELGFAGYLTPSFNRFEDEDGNPTLSFLIMYRFSFDTISIGWFIKSLLKIGILIGGIIAANKYGLFSWISSLI